MWIQKETKYIKRENSDNKYVQICNTTAKYNPISFKIGFPVFILAAQIKEPNNPAQTLKDSDFKKINVYFCLNYFVLVLLKMTLKALHFDSFFPCTIFAIENLKKVSLP